MHRNKVDSGICVKPPLTIPNFPDFKKPLPVGFYSIDTNLDFQPNDRELRYLKLPAVDKFPLNLNEGLDFAIKKDIGIGDFDNVLKFLYDHYNKIFLTTNPPEFVAFRGVLRLIMCTPYETRQDWCIHVTRFNGTFYLSERETDQKKFERLYATEQQRTFCAYGFKFEQYCLSKCPSTNPDVSEPVDERAEFACVFQTRLETLNLLYSAEMDGIMSDEAVFLKEKQEMIEKKSEKAKQEPKPRDDGVELENQFILRLPEEAAKVLREALQSPSSNLKDRISIRLDNDLRYGEVRFDHWLLHAKVVDLPTIIECLKTIDNKTFYKSADICQMMICKEEPHDLDNNESPNKGKKKDPNKVDKKFLWAHGITPPCKNVRKRRFRKTLKKKNVEAPEIEKEVKRLLRIDNDAVKVEFEIINEDLDKRSPGDHGKDRNEADEEFPDDAINERGKAKSVSSFQKDINVESEGDDEEAAHNRPPNGGVGEHDIFGEEVSSSDDEADATRHNDSRMRDLDDTSRLSAEDSRMSGFSLIGRGALGGIGGNNVNVSVGGVSLNNSKEDLNDYGKVLSGSPKQGDNDDSKYCGSTSNLGGPPGFFEERKRPDSEEDSSIDAPQMRVEQIRAKISELRRHLNEIKAQHSQKAQEISSIQNPTLRQRMQETLDNLASQMIEKELEIKDYENML
uniref:TAFII55 protein conserved region domain-containing protein n=1 Tax=Glossina austeni TaxID=7395 RepID=A0A1A9V0E7_GLOAU